MCRSLPKEGRRDEPSSHPKKLKPYNAAMLKTSEVGKTNCELDIGICEFKLNPLAKVRELLQK